MNKNPMVINGCVGSIYIATVRYVILVLLYFRKLTVYLIVLKQLPIIIINCLSSKESQQCTTTIFTEVPNVLRSLDSHDKPFLGTLNQFRFRGEVK